MAKDLGEEYGRLRKAVALADIMDGLLETGESRFNQVAEWKWQLAVSMAFNQGNIPSKETRELTMELLKQRHQRQEHCKQILDLMFKIKGLAVKEEKQKSEPVAQKRTKKQHGHTVGLRVKVIRSLGRLNGPGLPVSLHLLAVDTGIPETQLRIIIRRSVAVGYIVVETQGHYRLSDRGILAAKYLSNNPGVTVLPDNFQFDSGDPNYRAMIEKTSNETMESYQQSSSSEA